jgi:hypothetical protein
VIEGMDITKKALSFIQLCGQSLVHETATKASAITDVSCNAEGS